MVVGDGEESKALEFKAVNSVEARFTRLWMVGKCTHHSGHCTGQVRKVMDKEGCAQGAVRMGGSVNGRCGARESVWIGNRGVSLKPTLAVEEFDL